MKDLKRKEKFKTAKLLLILVLLPFFVLACSMFGNNSPTEVFKAFLEASKNKNSAGMKKHLSQKELNRVKEIADYEKKSDDEILITFNDKLSKISDFKDEKISDDGKTASLQFKAESGSWEPVYFSKDGSAWKIEFTKPTSYSENKSSSDNKTQANSNSPTSNDTSPVSISAASLVSEAMSATEAEMDKYKGRMMTISGAELWEIQYSMLHIGPRYGSYSSGYIICNGSFSDYMPYASKVSDMKRQGKALGATIKGQFSRVVRDSGYTQVHLSPCVLSDLEK